MPRNGFGEFRPPRPVLSRAITWHTQTLRRSENDAPNDETTGIEHTASFAAAIDPDDEVLVEAVKYFQVYQQALRDACAIDFADMVPLVVKAMTENESYRCSITSAYDHVLVDEYQDVDPGQVGLIDHFVNDGVRLGRWATPQTDRARPP
jgi:ATP-dependent exoDNAse (exonuclease V) beta subunit